jgi:Protein of unknown function (DUF1573)
MKYIKLIYALLILLIIIIWGIYIYQKKKDLHEFENITQIKVDQSIINVGKRVFNKPVTAQFKITNIGVSELLLSKVTTDCSCTAPNWYTKSIAPNKTTIVTLIYDAHSTGFFQKKAIVTGNFNESPVVLVLRGEIINQ